MNIKSIINFQNKNLSYFVSMSFVSSFSRETIFLKKKKKKKKNCHRAVWNLPFVLSKPPGMSTTSTQNSTLDEYCSGTLKKLLNRSFVSDEQCVGAHFRGWKYIHFGSHLQSSTHLQYF